MVSYERYSQIEMKLHNINNEFETLRIQSIELKEENKSLSKQLKETQDRLEIYSQSQSQLFSLQSKIQLLEKEIIDKNIQLKLYHNEEFLNQEKIKLKYDKKVEELEKEITLYSLRADNIRNKENYINEVQNENEELLKKVNNMDAEITKINAKHFSIYDLKASNLMKKFYSMLIRQKEKYASDLAGIEKEAGSIKRLKILEMQELYKEVQEMCYFNSKLFDVIEKQEVMIMKLKTKLGLEEDMLSVFAEKYYKVNNELKIVKEDAEFNNIGNISYSSVYNYNNKQDAGEKINKTHCNTILNKINNIDNDNNKNYFNSLKNNSTSSFISVNNNKEKDSDKYNSSSYRNIDRMSIEKDSYQRVWHDLNIINKKNASALFDKQFIDKNNSNNTNNLSYNNKIDNLDFMDKISNSIKDDKENDKEQNDSDINNPQSNNFSKAKANYIKDFGENEEYEDLDDLTMTNFNKSIINSKKDNKFYNVIIPRYSKLNSINKFNNSKIKRDSITANETLKKPKKAVNNKSKSMIFNDQDIINIESILSSSRLDNSSRKYPELIKENNRNKEDRNSIIFNNNKYENKGLNQGNQDSHKQLLDINNNRLSRINTLNKTSILFPVSNMNKHRINDNRVSVISELNEISQEDNSNNSKNKKDIKKQRNLINDLRNKELHVYLSNKKRILQKINDTKNEKISILNKTTYNKVSKEFRVEDFKIDLNKSNKKSLYFRMSKVKKKSQEEAHKRNTTILDKYIEFL